MLQRASHVDVTFGKLWHNTSHASRARIINIEHKIKWSRLRPKLFTWMPESKGHFHRLQCYIDGHMKIHVVDEHLQECIWLTTEQQPRADRSFETGLSQFLGEHLSQGYADSIAPEA